MTFKLWTPNEVLTSTDLNNLAKQQVVGCTSGTRPSSPQDGMMTYETDAGPGTFRYRESGIGVWRSIISAVPLCVLTKGSATISNNSLTTITSWTELADDWNMYTSGSSIVIPYTGIYRVTLSVRWASQATVVGIRGAQIHVGGVEQMSFNLAPTTALNATNVMTPVSHDMQLTAAEQVEGKVFQTSGGSLDIISNTRITVQMLREG